MEDCLTIFDRDYNLSDLFKSYLEETSVSSSSSSYYGNWYTVYFYEWSNIMSRPRQFGSAVVFKKFLDDCGITYSDYQNTRLSDGKWFYASCVPGKNQLILCDSYMQLRERLTSR